MIKRHQQEHEQPLRLLIVDGITHTRHNLASFLQLQENMVVVGETAVAAQAIHLTQKLKPDVVIMDINLPDMDGFMATRRLLTLDSPPTVILLTIHPRVQDVQQAQAVGAIDCIDKSAGVDAILDILHTLSPITQKENVS